MKRRNTETLSALLAQYLRTEGLETPLAQRRAEDAWPHIVGQQAAGCTEHVAVHGQTMVVRLSSPIVRHELFMRREEIIEKLNTAAGRQIIYNLHLT